MAHNNVNQRQAVEAIVDHVPFSASALTGKWSQYPNWHLLSGADAALLMDDQRNATTQDGRIYVVYSYATPIAWWNGETWTVPGTKYSATTSRHQSIVRRVIR